MAVVAVGEMVATADRLAAVAGLELTVANQGFGSGGTDAGGRRTGGLLAIETAPAVRVARARSAAVGERARAVGRDIDRFGVSQTGIRIGCAVAAAHQIV